MLADMRSRQLKEFHAPEDFQPESSTNQSVAKRMAALIDSFLFNPIDPTTGKRVVGEDEIPELAALRGLQNTYSELHNQTAYKVARLHQAMGRPYSFMETLTSVNADDILSLIAATGNEKGKDVADNLTKATVAFLLEHPEKLENFFSSSVIASDARKLNPHVQTPDLTPSGVGPTGIQNIEDLSKYVSSIDKNRLSTLELVIGSENLSLLQTHNMYYKMSGKIIDTANKSMDFITGIDPTFVKDLHRQTPEVLAAVFKNSNNEYLQLNVRMEWLNEARKKATRVVRGVEEIDHFAWADAIKEAEDSGLLQVMFSDPVSRNILTLPAFYSSFLSKGSEFGPSLASTALAGNLFSIKGLATVSHRFIINPIVGAITKNPMLLDVISNSLGKTDKNILKEITGSYSHADFTKAYTKGRAAGEEYLKNYSKKTTEVLNIFGKKTEEELVVRKFDPRALKILAYTATTITHNPDRNGTGEMFSPRLFDRLQELGVDEETINRFRNVNSPAMDDLQSKEESDNIGGSEGNDKLDTQIETQNDGYDFNDLGRLGSGE
jgi:hypothetical protein